MKRSEPTKKPNSTRSRGLSKKLRQLNQDLTGVRETSRLLAAPLELQQVLELVVKTVAQAIGVEAAGLRLLDAQSGQLVLKATYGLSDAYIKKGLVTADQSHINTNALKGQVFVIDDMRTHPDFAQYHQAILNEGLVSNLTIGLTYKDQGIGTLRLYSKTPKQFSDEDIATAQIVASQSAVAIVNARLYAEAIEYERIARQVKLAGEVQKHLIPQTPPELAGVELAGLYVPCYDVGGDFYDFIKITDQRLIITLGDIMGKGVPASLKMASLRATLRAYAAHFTSLNDLITRANRMFCHDNTPGEFATLFCAVIDPAHNTFTYCSCGHEPAILIRDNTVSGLSDGGTVLGLDAKSIFQTEQITLKPDDLILMFTDGLADAVNFNHEPFTRQRVADAALQSAHMTASQAAKNILWLMRKFAGLTTRFDDTALIVLKKLPD